MNSTNWIIGIVAVVIIAGGAYYLAQPSMKGDAMMQESAAAGEAMHDDAMATDTMMASSSDTMMATSSDTMHDASSSGAMMK